MNILLTNDDGYKSRGLMTLRDTLSKKHSVYVLAPASNRSAVSHCIKMSEPLELVCINEEKNIYSCSGFPADCVISGVGGLFPKIDCVISGINYGANIGTDIIFSGTCGAARQGSLYGIPSLAVSVEHPAGYEAREEEYEFQAMADFILENLEKLVSYTQNLGVKRAFVNINGLSLPEYKGMKEATEISIRDYGDQIRLEKTEKGYLSHFIPGRSKTLGGENCDYRVARDGYVAVSVIASDPGTI